MKKLLLALFLTLNFGFANDIASRQDTAEKNLFKSPEEINEACKATCREVDNKFVALVTNFNPKTGMTYCSIYSKDDFENKIGINANTKNTKCINVTNQKLDISTMSSFGKRYDERLNVVFKPNQITLSKFLAGLVTLDPELVNFESTKATGILELKNPTAIYGTNTADVNNRKELVATADSFNKANLAYYSNLYSNMGKIYTALQFILLICIGGYFFSVLAVKELNNRIEKQTSQTKVLNTFLIPVVVFATFFTPIPESSGMNGTIIQKSIRASAQWSNYYADKIGSVGAESYMNKLYSSVGGFTAEGEKTLRENEINIKTAIVSLQVSLDECKKRFPITTTFMQENENSAKFNLNREKEKYTFRGCQNIEHALQSHYALQRQNKILTNALDKNIKNNALQALLRQINAGVERRESELGWINSTIIPGMSVLVENLPLINENDVAKEIQESDKKLTEEASKKKKGENIKDRDEEIEWKFLEDSVFMSALPYFMLPGAGEVYQKFEKLISSVAGGIGGALTGWIPIVGELVKSGSNIAAIYGGVYMTSNLYDKILHFIPLTVSIVAAALAFLAYIIELAKFFYITPFVTAFALTTGKQNQITNFLVTGITIFLKPILIVIFIYFALFIYGLFADIFMVYATEQISALHEISNQITINIVLSVFKGLLKIIGCIGATYIMWKLIMTAPSWVLKMIGLNDSNVNNVTEQLGRNLEKYSFQL